MFYFYVFCSLLYCILLLDKNYRQYLMRYIIFYLYYIGCASLKKARASSAPQGSKRLLRLKAPRGFCASVRLK